MANPLGGRFQAGHGGRPLSLTRRAGMTSDADPGHGAAQTWDESEAVSNDVILLDPSSFAYLYYSSGCF